LPCAPSLEKKVDFFKRGLQKVCQVKEFWRVRVHL
jgi:hypothetical protein